MQTLNFSKIFTKSNESLCSYKKNLQAVRRVKKVYKNVVTDTTAVHITQLTFTCSKSTIETQEQGVKYVQSQ